MEALFSTVGKLGRLGPYPSIEGKVRDIYDFGKFLLIVATDRISAFDVVLRPPIPGKGRILTQLTLHWLRKLPYTHPHHLRYADISGFPRRLRLYPDILKGRSMLVHKAEVIPVECVVRGYLAGSGWNDYQENGSVCGIELPSGLRFADKLPEPIFTPATKAPSGTHDVNITARQAIDLVGKEAFEYLRTRSINLYSAATAYALARGVIIADTKLEFGRDELGRIMLIDEILTPDSSRFWPAEEYRPGEDQPSFDKQPIRDYLDSIGWNHQPPAPELPQDVVEGTMQRYQEALRRLTA